MPREKKRTIASLAEKPISCFSVDCNGLHSSAADGPQEWNVEHLWPNLIYGMPFSSQPVTTLAFDYRSDEACRRYTKLSEIRTRCCGAGHCWGEQPRR